MSLKGIELQIAIPKTFDAGKVADQKQQSIINQQLHANDALKKDAERKQFIVSEADETNNISDKEEGHTSSNEQFSQKKRKKALIEENEKVSHPFKGNLIDFSR